MSAKPRSIVHIADYAPSYSGNFIASLRLAAAECRARGFRIVWVFPQEVDTFNWFRELANEAYSTAYVLARSATLWSLAREIAGIAYRENAAIVHTHFSRFDIAAFLAKAICAVAAHSFEIVWHFHSAFSGTGMLRGIKDLAKLRGMGRLCHAVPVSYPLAEDVRERGFPESRIHVIQNGIDLTHATASSRTRSDMRRQLGIPEPAFLMLGFGWTPVRKGVDTMLEALKILLDAGRDVHLVIVGTDELHHYLERWRDRSYMDRVHVIPPAEMIGDLFAACDVFLSPSRAEGWCYAVAEAMANGVPAASSEIPTLSWAVGAPGVFFSKPEDGAGLARNVSLITDLNADERREIGNRAREFVASRHSVELWGQSVWDLYARLLDWKEPDRRHPVHAAAGS